MPTAANTSFDSMKFRGVIGCYPTGVAVITSAFDGSEVGIAVNSFTSVSLDPPLVAFCPQKTSGTWARIAKAGRFCVNILADDQSDQCRRFAGVGGKRFEGLDYAYSDTGLPIIDGVIGWIECTIHSVSDAGDHFIVVGLVQDLEHIRDADPLVFFRGNYRQIDKILFDEARQAG